MAMAPMEVDGRSRRRERDAVEEDETTTAAVKRRKLEEEEAEGESRNMLSSPVKLENGGGIVPRDSEELPGREQCHSPKSEDNLRRSSTSCCSSHGFSEKHNGGLDFLDLEQYNVAGKGTSWNCSSSASEENEESESVEVKASEAAESCGRSTVTEAELEAFFMAEKDLRYKILEYSSKYNFDFVKEEALDGRYEWVKLKP